jgi:pimeloyl-ACP methyl ester carboxylesterase
MSSSQGGAELQRMNAPLGSLSFRQAGAAAPTHVLLHGIGSASGSWQAQLAWAQGRSDLGLLAWDAPGYGSSSPVVPAQPQAADYAQRLWDWLDALGVQGPLVLVGHSLGALMAARAALLRPHQVKQVLLLSPARGYGDAPAAERERMVAGRLNNLQQLGPAGMAQARAAAMLSPQATPAMVEQVRRTMAAIDPAGYTQAVHLLAQGRLLHDVSQLRLPVTVASGEADTITVPAACDEVAAAAGVQRLSLGAVGHACSVEAAQGVIALLQASSARDGHRHE